MGNKIKLYLDIMACHPEVTGSCFLAVLKLPNRETVKFVIDCGLFQEKEYDSLNNELPFDCDEISFVVVTHNHVDHIGRLPLLFKRGYNGKVYCSTQTKILLPLALNDSQKVLADVCKRKHQSSLYNVKDVETTLNNVVGVDFNNKIKVTPNIEVTFLENGHLIGAAMILIEINYPGEEPINVLFTGDYNNKNEFLNLHELPMRVRNKRMSVVIESTYGDTSVEEINHGFFSEKVLEAIEERKTIILPVFSLGRSQEILLRLKELQDTNKLDVNIPIYFDGKLAQAYTALYCNSKILIDESKKDFFPRNLVAVNCEIREKLLQTDDCKIIVTTSGMGTYGPAQVYIPYFISKENALILFTGYTAEGSFGANLRNAEEGEIVKVGGLICKKFADVSYCNEFSAHAKSEELIELLKKFNNLRGVLINHGQTETKDAFAEKILKEIDISEVGILNREYFFRIGSYGEKVPKYFGTFSFILLT